MKIKINWKVRIKQPTFWIATIPVIVSFVYALLAFLGIVPSITEEIVQNLFIAIIAVLVEFGVITDPTTKGFSDSDRAMSYDEPSGGADNE